MGNDKPYRVEVNSDGTSFNVRGPAVTVYGITQPDKAGDLQCWLNAAYLAGQQAQAERVAKLEGALRECSESLARLPDVDGAFRVTIMLQARALLLTKE